MNEWMNECVCGIGEMMLTAKAAVNRENLSQCHLGHHTPHMDWPGNELRPVWQAAGD